MKLIEPSVEYWKQYSDLIPTLKHIERCGRICYKSEDRITDDSYIKFINMLKSKKHFSVFEHGTIYLTLESDKINNAYLVVKRYMDNPFSKVYIESYVEDDELKSIYYITTNYRVIVENKWEDDLKYLSNYTKHIRRYTIHFICDRGIWNEFIRHRVLSRIDDTDIIDLDSERKFSFSQESTRYCNYSQDKFGNELTFIKPNWFESSFIEKNGHWDANTFYRSNKQSVIESSFLGDLHTTELNYFNLLEEGWKPEQARNILPLCLKTELVMTGFADDWTKFIILRSAPNAHPQAKQLAAKVENYILSDTK